MCVLWSAYSGVKYNDFFKINYKNVPWSWKYYQIWNQREILLHFDVSYVQIGQKLTDLQKIEVGEIIEGQYDERRAADVMDDEGEARYARNGGGGGHGGARSEKKNKMMKKKKMMNWLLY